MMGSMVWWNFNRWFEPILAFKSVHVQTRVYFGRRFGISQWLFSDLGTPMTVMMYLSMEKRVVMVSD